MSDEMNLEPTVWTLYDTNKGALVKMTTDDNALNLSPLTANRFAEAVQLIENSSKEREKLKKLLIDAQIKNLGSRPPYSEYWEHEIASKIHDVSIARCKHALGQLLYEVAPQLFKEHVTQGAENV